MMRVLSDTANWLTSTLTIPSSADATMNAAKWSDALWASIASWVSHSSYSW